MNQFSRGGHSGQSYSKYSRERPAPPPTSKATKAAPSSALVALPQTKQQTAQPESAYHHLGTLPPEYELRERALEERVKHFRRQMDEHHPDKTGTQQTREAFQKANEGFRTAKDELKQHRSAGRG